MRWRSWRRLVPGAVLAGLIALPYAATASNQVPAADSAWLFSPDFSARARAVPAGGTLVVEDVPLAEPTSPRTPALPRTRNLELERFRVFSADAQIVVHERAGPETFQAPAIAHFRGRIEGEPDSMAVLSVAEDGSVRGFVSDREHLWALASEQPGAAPKVAPIDANSPLADAPAPWSCGQEDLPLPPPEPASRQSAAPELARIASDEHFTVRVAIETDYEFRNMFSSNEEAAAYVADLIAAASAIYERDVNTSLEVVYLSLWPNGSTSDPWTITSSTSSALSEFRNYWVANRWDVDRSTAHFLSGKPLGGGIAYVGVLCNYVYGFGLTGSLRGEFSTTDPWLFWDLLAVSHELGHNFGTHHTHCYDPPVDQCYKAESGCYSGSETGVPTNGGGSIMSYCHLQSGGYSNQNFWFGRAGYYGTQSERVPAQMRAHVESRAACLQISEPPVVSLSAVPATIPAGSAAMLSWSATDAVSCTASGAWSGTKSTSGSQAVSPAATSAYTLTCTGAGGEDDASVTVTVADPPVVDLVATPATIGRGESTTLSWTSSLATSCTASGAWSGARSLSGSMPVSPGGTMTYVLTCTGAGGSTSDSIAVTVELPEPGILTADFDAGAEGWSGQGSWAMAGEAAHGTGQGWSDSPGGDYANGTDATLWSPPFDLSRYASASATFWHRHEFAGGDVGEVWIDDDGGLALVASFGGSSDGWTEDAIDLDAYAGRPAIRLGFRIVTDAGAVADGWHVDDVAVAGIESGTGFHPLTPCRAIDTRDAGGPYGGQALPGASDRFFDLAGSCGVPMTARAVSVILTVVSPTATGHVRLFPADQARPETSALNFTPGMVRANNAIAKLPMDGLGDLGFYNSAGSTHLVVDVTGYFD